MADVKPSIEIDRRLEREDPTARAPVIIDQAAIVDLDGPIVILGDPGLGKSVLAQACSSCTVIRAVWNRP